MEGVCGCGSLHSDLESYRLLYHDPARSASLKLGIHEKLARTNSSKRMDRQQVHLTHYFQ
jgi:hypothetical protein